VDNGLHEQKFLAYLIQRANLPHEVHVAATACALQGKLLPVFRGHGGHVLLLHLRSVHTWNLRKGGDGSFLPTARGDDIIN